MKTFRKEQQSKNTIPVVDQLYEAGMLCKTVRPFHWDSTDPTVITVTQRRFTSKQLSTLEQLGFKEVK